MECRTVKDGTRQWWRAHANSFQRFICVHSDRRLINNVVSCELGGGDVNADHDGDQWKQLAAKRISFDITELDIDIAVHRPMYMMRESGAL